MSDGTALTGTAVNEVAGIAQKAALVQQLEFGGYEFTDREMHRVNTDPKLPKALEFYSLLGLVQYLKAEGFPGEGGNKPLVHVVSPTRVEIVSRLFGEDLHLRRHLAVATCRTAVLQGFGFNQHQSMEALNIALLTCFEPGRGDVEELRQFCANVKSTAEIGVADDGVSQTVTGKAGIAAVQRTAVKSLWQLAPWRTFADIKQPVSPFVLRFKTGEAPVGGLWETGDARWQVEAIEAIAIFLRTALGEQWQVLG